MCVELTTGTRLARRAARVLPALLSALGAILLTIGTTLTVRAEPAARDTPAPVVTTTDVADLKFSQFFKSPIGPAGLELSDALRAADGRPVRLVGYMVAQEQARPGRFWLTPRPVRMSEHADGEADDLPAATVTVLVRAAGIGDIVAHGDEQFYLLTGDRMLNWGAVPYADIWDRKPVGLFLLYAGIRLLGGNGIIAYQLSALAAVAATSLKCLGK